MVNIFGKAKWKPLELALPDKIVNRKQYLISGGIPEINATIKNFKDAGIEVYTSPFNSPIYSVKNTGGSGRMVTDRDFPLPVAEAVPPSMPG